MSEYLLDSGHRTMRTCDECGGAFHCAAPSREKDPEDCDAPDWTCDTCADNATKIKDLADAMAGLSVGTKEELCWCLRRYPLGHVKECVDAQAAMLAVGRFK